MIFMPRITSSLIGPKNTLFPLGKHPDLEREITVLLTVYLGIESIHLLLSPIKPVICVAS